MRASSRAIPMGGSTRSTYPAATALQLGDALVPLEKTLAVVLDSTTALRKLL